MIEVDLTMKTHHSIKTISAGDVGLPGLVQKVVKELEMMLDCDFCRRLCFVRSRLAHRE